MASLYSAHQLVLVSFYLYLQEKGKYESVNVE